MIKGTIPIKPHLKKFVCWLENLKEDDHINLYQRTTIPRILKLLLTFKTEIIIDSDRPLPQDLTDQISYSLTIKRLDRGDIHLTKAGIIEFNSFLHYLFHDMLLARVVREVGKSKPNKKTEKQVIYEFLEEIGIEDIVNYESVKKSSYRLRKEKNMGVFSDRSVDALELVPVKALNPDIA